VKAVNGDIMVLASSNNNRLGDVYVRPFYGKQAEHGAPGALYFKPEDAKRLAAVLIEMADEAGRRVEVYAPMGADW
jgi:hypothetical protein